jgi:hypothetical protein
VNVSPTIGALVLQGPFAAATRYAVNFVYPDFANDPPVCRRPVGRQIPSFTTQ